MNVNKILKYILLSGSIFFLYINSFLWHNGVCGWAFFILFLILTNRGYESALKKFFDFSDTARVKIIAVFVNLLLLSYLWGIAVIFYRLNSEVIMLALVGSGIFSLFLEYFTRGFVKHNVVEVENFSETPKNNLYLIVFFILSAIIFYSLLQANSDGVFITPWQAVSYNHIYIFFLLLLVLGGLIFFKFKAGLVLCLLSVTAFLMSAILPLTTDYIYGADGWRHLAAESALMSGEKYSPTVYSGDDELTLIQKINPGLFSYGQFRGTSVALGNILQTDLLAVTRWFAPISWSIFFILFLFEIGVSLGLKENKALYLCLMGLWPFALQTIGYFSLPTGLGFLSFLFLLLLLIKKSKNPCPGQDYFLMLFGILSFFGYFLYFLVFWISFGLLIWLRLWHDVKSRLVKKISLAVAVIMTAGIVPILEILAGYSFYKFSLMDFLAGIKQLVGNLTAFYLADGPRTHIINTGNIFFNQTPSYGFYGNGLTEWRWWIFVFMIFVLVSLFLGLRKFLKSKEVIYRWWGILTAGLFGGYIISRYFLSGENVIGRRMDVLLALFAIVIVFFFWRRVLDKKQVAIFFILILASAIAASYSLGPVSRSVSHDEYATVESISGAARNAKHPCVAADTYPLLILEYLSAQKVVGGGFPIDEYFAQPELVGLYQGFLTNQDIYYFNEAKKITGAESCIFIVPSGIITEEAEKFRERGGMVEFFGSMGVIKI